MVSFPPVVAVRASWHKSDCEDARRKELEARARHWDRLPAGKLSPEDKELLRQEKDTLKVEMGNLKQVESALGRGDKPEQEPGKPWTKSSVAAAKAKVLREMRKIQERLRGEEAQEAATAQDLWDKTFGKDDED